mgnify:CR=1 FL=1
MGDHERGKLDDSGSHYDGCAGGPCGCDGGSGGSPRRGGGGDGLWIILGLIVVFGGVIGLAELTGIPLEKLVDRDNTFRDVSSVSVVWSDYSFVLLRIERIFSIKISQKRKKV